MDKHFYIELSGTPYEIGFGHGSKAKEYVLNSLRTYKAMFMDYAGLVWDDAKKSTRQFIPYIERFDPDILEEMKGVADGAGLDFEDILALNARSEVLTRLSAETQLSDGCTNISVTPERTVDGHTLLAHNWDWKGSQIDSCIVMKIRQNGKPDILMITEAGIIGKFGVNSCGIGVAMNALCTPSEAEGVPLHVVLRGILNSERLADALKLMTSVPNACPANYMMGSGAGECIDVEMAPQDFEVLYPVDSVLVHTNHFTSPKLKLKLQDTGYLLVSDTYIRRGRTDKLIRAHEKISAENMKSALSDHVEFPGSACRHDNPKEPPEKTMCTVFSMVLDLTDKTMELCKGNPCSGEYYKLSLN